MKFILILVGIFVCTVSVYAQVEDPNQIVYQGRILDERGKPVVDAWIDIYDIPQIKFVPYSTTHAGRITTNDEGRFSFSRYKAIFDQIDYSIAIIQAEGYALQWVYYLVEGKISEIILSSKTASFEGRVVDSQKQPVQDAMVYAFLSRDNAVKGIPALSCKTDSQGHFVIDNLSINAKAEFHVAKEGYAGMYTFRTNKHWPSSKYSAGQHDILLYLKKEASLSGQLIRSDTKQPLPGESVSVVLYQGDDDPYLFKYNVLNNIITVRGTYTGKDSCTIKTDADGRFSLEHLTSGQYTIFHHNFLSGLFTPRLSIVVEEDQHQEILIEAIAGENVVIKGAFENGTIPQQDVRVSLKNQKADEEDKYDAFWKRIDEGKCDSEGRFHFKVLPGRYEVEVRSKTAELVGQNPVFDVPSLTYPSLILTSKKAKPQITGLGGICESPEGLPIANARVYLLSDPNNVVYTDSKGHFVLEPRLEECKKNVWWKYQEKKERYGSFSRYPEKEWMGIGTYLIGESPNGNSVALHNFYSHRDLQKGTRSLKLVLKPAYTITGKAVDTDNQPIEEATVEVLMAEVSFDPEYVYKRAVTDEKGRFTVPGLVMKKNYKVILTTPDGAYYVKHFSAGLMPDGYSTVEHIYAKNAGRVNLGKFLMNTETLEVSGVVTDILGKAVSNARLTLRAPVQGIQHEEVFTKKDGRFEFNELFAGPVEILCHAGKKGYVSFTTVAGMKDVRMVFDKKISKTDMGTTPIPSAAVEMSFSNQDTGEPIILPKAYISIKQENGNDFDVPLDDEGKARFLIGPGKNQFKLLGTDRKYRPLKKKFTTELYQLYSFQYQAEYTEKYKVTIEAGSIVYPEVLSKTENIWNLKTRTTTSDFYKVLEILILDGVMGIPVPEAEVLISFNNGNGRYLGKTNANGKVSFAVFSNTINCVLTSITCPGYIESHPQKRLSTTYSGITKREFRIKRNRATVNITVLDPEAEPAPGVWLYHSYFVGDKWIGLSDKNKRLPTDENGQLQIRWIDERGQEPKIEHFIHTLYVHKQKGFIAQVVKAMPDSEVVLQIIPAVQVQGRILDADGNGIPNQSFNFHYLINGKTLVGPYAKSREGGYYKPVPIAHGFDYEIHISRDRKGTIDGSATIFIEESDSIIHLPDCVFLE